MSTTPVCPYRRGGDISLKDEDGNDLKLQILSTFQPYSSACAMKVTAVDRPDLPNRMVLKLADWRWLESKREDSYDLPTYWNQGQEEAYVSSVLNGHISEWEKEGCPHRWQIDRGKRTAENEARLAMHIRDFITQESHAYRRLEALQGTTIPKMFTTVTMNMWNHECDESANKWLQCSGILIELIEGPQLKELLKNLGAEVTYRRPEYDGRDDPARSLADQVIRSAVLSASILPCFGFAHDSLRPRNCVVRHGDYSKYENFVIIDLGRSRFLDEQDCFQYECDGFNFDFVNTFEYIDRRFYLSCLAIVAGVSERRIPDSPQLRRNYSSGRFLRVENNHPLQSPVDPFPASRDFTHAIIMADVWRCTEDFVRELPGIFERSRRVDRIVQESRFEDPKNANWERRHVHRVAEEIFHCDPEAAWEAYCKSKQTFGSDSIDDVVIFPREGISALNVDRVDKIVQIGESNSDSMLISDDGLETGEAETDLPTQPDPLQANNTPNVGDGEDVVSSEDVQVDQRQRSSKRKTPPMEISHEATSCFMSGDGCTNGTFGVDKAQKKQNLQNDSGAK